MRSDGNLPPGVTQNMIDAHLDGFAYGHEAPEQWTVCGHCGGEGETEEPHPFPDDPFYCRVVRCEKCGGAGGYIDAAEPDGEPCPYRHFTDEEEEAWEAIFRDAIM